MNVGKKAGFGLIEVLIAMSVILFGIIPLLWLMTTTRVDTGKSINYLRGLELAHEGLEWAQTVPFDSLEQLCQSDGTGSLFRGVIKFHPGSRFKGALANTIQYPAQYDTAYFYRTITCCPVDEDSAGFLKKVTVIVGWNEAKVPENLHCPDRMRMVKLSGLIFHEKNPAY